MVRVKKKQISVLVTQEMLDFLNQRAKVVGNRSEYIRHIILSDMYGKVSSNYVRVEREKQKKELSSKEKRMHQALQHELKQAFKKVRGEDDGDSDRQTGTERTCETDREIES